MVKIRMARGGAKKQPFYHIVVTDSRKSRDGRYIERLGYFNPVARGKDVRLHLNVDRADHWLQEGAQISERANNLLKQARKEVVQPVEAASP
ncbi:MAG: 30S ribosomal protein S16 [Gammaproteobacteria bacterium]|jgi:small subunit ribosomal protein S16|nr:30S ribosomal protein S16 [Gammaproteobacteria bacterium]